MQTTATFSPAEETLVDRIMAAYAAVNEPIPRNEAAEYLTLYTASRGRAYLDSLPGRYQQFEHYPHLEAPKVTAQIQRHFDAYKIDFTSFAALIGVSPEQAATFLAWVLVKYSGSYLMEMTAVFALCFNGGVDLAKVG